MTEKIRIGKEVEGMETVKIDLPTLIDTRLLIEANSGGGKSYLIRKFLEETHGKVQQIVLDMEGEFATLREKHDYVLVGKDGDIDISIRIAEMLAKKLLETGVSAIIDLYELKQHERIIFVKRFLEALVNLPKKYWHPCIIVLDEAHNFAPEKGSCESSPAVIDLAARGRKRGYCGVVATQRLSKLKKDVAAECNNKLIGRTGLDIDMKRAADELGFMSKQDMLSLRSLEPGEFFAFGPAVSKEVIKVKIDRVKTTHPKAGSRKLGEIPPVSDKVKKILSKLGDLPKQADEELKSVDDLKRKVRELKFQLRTKKVEIRTDDKKTEQMRAKYERELKTYKVGAERQFKLKKREIKRVFTEKMKRLDNGIKEINRITSKLLEEPEPEFFKALRDIPAYTGNEGVPTKPPPKTREEWKQKKEEYMGTEEPRQLRAGAYKMLKAVAMFHPKMITKNQIATLSGFSVKGGTFNTYLSELKRNEWIYQEGIRIGITKEGMKNAGEVQDLPGDPQQLVEMWKTKFRAGAGKLLEVLAEIYPQTISKEELGERTGFVHTGGTFNTYLSELRRNGLVEIINGEIKAGKELFMED